MSTLSFPHLPQVPHFRFRTSRQHDIAKTLNKINVVVNVEPDADPFVFSLLPLLRLLSVPSNINSASIRLLGCITFLSFCSREKRNIYSARTWGLMYTRNHSNWSQFTDVVQLHKYVNAIRNIKGSVMGTSASIYYWYYYQMGKDMHVTIIIIQLKLCNRHVD